MTENGKSTLAIAFSTIAIVLIFFPIVVPSFRSVYTDNDTTATLSILVTVLMGWNIYALIDVKLLAKQMQKRMKESQLNELLLGAGMHASLANIHSSQFEIVSGHEYYFLLHELRAIMYFSHLEKYDSCSHHIRDVLRFREQIIVLQLSFEQKEDLFSSMKNVANCDRIYQWDDFCALMKELKVAN